MKANKAIKGIVLATLLLATSCMAAAHPHQRLYCHRPPAPPVRVVPARKAPCRVQTIVIKKKGGKTVVVKKVNGRTVAVKTVTGR